MVLYRSSHLALSSRQFSATSSPPRCERSLGSRQDPLRSCCTTGNTSFSVVLYRSNHTLGSVRVLGFSHCTSGSNEIAWRFIVATTQLVLQLSPCSSTVVVVHHHCFVMVWIATQCQQFIFVNCFLLPQCHNLNLKIREIKMGVK